MFAPEGHKLIGAATGLFAVLTGVGVVLGGLWLPAFALVGAVLLGFTLYFFRDPARTVPAEASNGHLLLAPADGRVVVVADVAYEPLYLKGPAKQVSIFLSPLNVHVNRVPADGLVEFDRYVPGEYLVAWHEKASEKNERSQLGLVHPSGTRVLFKQIAGAIARRIVYHIGVGDRVKAGQRFGIVKFGSRMDILVPPHVELRVAVGDRTVAGVTVMGRFPEAAQRPGVPHEARPSVVEVG